MLSRCDTVRFRWFDQVTRIPSSSQWSMKIRRMSAEWLLKK